MGTLEEFERKLAEHDVPVPVRQDAVALYRVLLETVRAWGMEGEEGVRESKTEVRAWIGCEGFDCAVLMREGESRPRLLLRTVLGPRLLADLFERAREGGVRSFHFDLQGRGLRMEGEYDVGVVQVKVVGGEAGWELLEELKERGLSVAEV
ncbi:hypothetical protein [Methanopyrus sp.]